MDLSVRYKDTDMRYGIVIAVIVIIGLGLIAAYNMNAGSGSSDRMEESRVCFGDECFTVELALTPDQQSRGLMFREQMDEDRGMLFVFEEEGIHPFWMKNTLIPLDIIWIDSEKEVVFISRDTQPCRSAACPTINPGTEAKYVLEINAGLSEQMGLSVGGSANIDY